MGSQAGSSGSQAPGLSSSIAMVLDCDMEEVQCGCCRLPMYMKSAPAVAYCSGSCYLLVKTGMTFKKPESLMCFYGLLADKGVSQCLAYYRENADGTREIVHLEAISKGKPPNVDIPAAVVSSTVETEISVPPLTPQSEGVLRCESALIPGLIDNIPNIFSRLNERPATLNVVQTNHQPPPVFAGLSVGGPFQPEVSEVPLPRSDSLPNLECIIPGCRCLEKDDNPHLSLPGKDSETIASAKVFCDNASAFMAAVTEQFLKIPEVAAASPTSAPAPNPSTFTLGVGQTNLNSTSEGSPKAPPTPAEIAEAKKRWANKLRENRFDIMRPPVPIWMDSDPIIAGLTYEELKDAIPPLTIPDLGNFYSGLFSSYCPHMIRKDSAQPCLTCRRS